MQKVEAALANFNQGNGFNCSQSVLEVFSSDLGLDSEIAYKVSGLFGGGIGKTGETCGAVTGALMALGLKYGSTELEDKVGRQKAAAVAQQFIEQFKIRNGSLKCKELLGIDISTDKGLEEIKEKRMAVSHCTALISDAVVIVEDLI